MSQEHYSSAQIKAAGGLQKLLNAVLKPRNKFGNKHCVWKGNWRGREQEIKFQSEKEMREMVELIFDPDVIELRFQEKFPIAIAANKKVKYYIADAVYKRISTQSWYIHDPKGVKTAIYLLKRDLVKEKYPSMIFIES